MKDRDKTILKGVFGIIFLYIVVEHFSVVKGIFVTCYHAVSPLIYGMVIAFLLNLIVVKLENHMKSGVFENQAFKRMVSVIVSFLIVVGIITIVCFNVIPGIVDSVKEIARQIPQAVAGFLDLLEKQFGVSKDILEEIQNFEVDENMLDSMFGLMMNKSVLDALKASSNVVGGAVSVITRLFIGIFFACYILARKEAILAYVQRLMETYLPNRIAAGLEYVGHITYETYANFISGQCLDAVILGGLVAICMGIMGLSYPILIGVVIAVTALIPIVGAFFGGGIGVFLLIMESPIKALTFLILFLVLQQIDNRLIYPHIVGNAIGIPSILIFAAIIIGGEFNGVIGMFMGIPFTAVIYTLIDHDMEKRRRRAQSTESIPEE